MNQIPESIFRNKTVKVIFLIGVTVVMMWAGVPFWNAFLLALFGTLVGGIIVFMVENLAARKNGSG
jgi:pilus assembly protein TadC